MMNLPSLRHLRHLMALHDHGHFGRAAEACGVTQSTLSASIKELEGVLETTLVDRSKRRVVLTPVGIEAVEVSSGAAAPGAAMNFACLQKNSWNAPSRNQNLPRSNDNPFKTP